MRNGRERLARTLGGALVAGVACIGAVPAQAAGSGLYDMSGMLAEPHPFAGPVYGAAPAYAPFGTPQPGYPPAYLASQPPAAPAGPFTAAPAPSFPTMTAPAPVPPPAPPPVAPAALPFGTPAPIIAATPTFQYTPPTAPRAAAPYYESRMQTAGSGALPARAADPAGDGAFGGVYGRLYVAARGGVDLPEDVSTTAGTAEADTGFVGLLAFGSRFEHGLRGELELGYRRADFELGGTSDSLDSFGVLVNGYYDFYYDFPVVPYVGLGVGAAQLKREKLGGGASDETAFAYQGIVGFGYDITDRIGATLDYRYFSTTEDDTASQSIVFGVRFDL